MPISQINTNSIANGAVVAADLAAGAALSNLGTSQLARANMSAGSILQVVTYTKTNKTLCNATTNTMTEQDTNFRVSITPTSSSSRFLVFLNINGGSTTGCPRFRMEFSTNGGSSWSFVTPVGDVDGSRTQSHCSLNINGDANPMNSASAEVLFAPATTSTIIFRILMGADQPNYMMWNGSRNNSNDFLGQTTTSTYRVMEIAG